VSFTDTYTSTNTDTDTLPRLNVSPSEHFAALNPQYDSCISEREVAEPANPGLAHV
jgi:hypothetical protein